MHLGESSFRHSVEALRELFHSLRTPLGVALTVAKDSRRNLPLTLHDYEDAVSALERIRNYVDELTPILGLTEIDSVSLTLNDLVLVCELEGFELEYGTLTEFRTKIEVSLLKTWLKCFYKSFAERRRVSLKISNGELIFSLIHDKALDSTPSKTFTSLLAAACVNYAIKFELSERESRLSWSF